MAEKTRMCSDGKTRGTGREKLPETKCLTPGCQNMFGTPGAPGGRGLCKLCHAVASRMVARKTTTWEELERLELAQPKYGSKFELALIKARKAKHESERRLQEAGPGTDVPPGGSDDLPQ